MQDEKSRVLAEINKCRRELSRIGAMLKGSLNIVERKRGKDGKLRSARHSLTYKVEGNKTKTVYVRKNQVESVRRMTANHRRAKQTLDRIAELNLTLFRMGKENLNEKKTVTKLK